MNIEQLTSKLHHAWGVDTTASEADWTPENPTLGQCAVTALVVQDHFGGDLMRGTVSNVSHYWNRLPDGSEIDLTREQFGPNPTIENATTRERSYVLSFEKTVVRYMALLVKLRALPDLCTEHVDEETNE